MTPSLVLGIAGGIAVTAGALALRQWIRRGKTEVDPHSEQTPFAPDDLALFRARLSAAELSREAALREVHHRIKNNLQIVSSLFHLQERAAEDPAVVTALAAARQRVDMLAVTHAALYRHERLADVSLGELIGDLAAQMARELDGPGPQPRFELSLSDRIVSADQAVPLTLFFAEAVNQLASSAGERPLAAIGVALLENPDGDCTMRLSAHGGQDAPALSDPASLPYRLMTSVSRQLGGTWAMKQASAGLEIELTWLSSEV